MNTSAYIIVNLLLFSSWYIFLFRKKELISFIDRIIGSFVLGLMQIIVSEMLLGVLFKRLYALPLFFLNIVISIGILFFSFWVGRNTKSNIKTYYLKNILDEFKDGTIHFFRIVKNDLILFCIFSLLLVSVFWIIFLGSLFPSYTWDALWYHLPIVGYIMQNGAIQEVPNHSFIDQFINIFPKNLELFFLWNIIFLQNDVIVDLSQLIFALIGLLAVYSLSIKMGVHEKSALYSAMLFFFTPILLLQLTTNYVDVAISILFLISLNFLIQDKQAHFITDEVKLFQVRQRRLQVLLAGVTTGILFGAKGSGPLFVIVLSSTVIIQELVRNFKSSAFLLPNKGNIFKKSFIFYFVFFFVAVILVGGYWYIKNWVVYNNPVYPMEISFFNITIFKGLYQGIIEPVPEVIKRLSYLTRPLYVWLENTKYYLYDSRLGGLGPIWFILFIPSFLFSLGYAFVKKKSNFLTACIIFIAVFFMYPRNWTPRYSIFLVGLGALSFGFVFNYFSEKEKTIKIIALLLVVYTFMTSNSPCVTPKQIKKFIYLPSSKRTIARHAPFNIDLYARQEYGHWIWISDHISKGDTMAYTFEPLFLAPLWNSSFSNRIVYVKSDSYSEWLKKLKENKITYVLLRQNSREDKWIKKERGAFYSIRWLGSIKETFKIVYADENYKIVKFKKT